MILNVSSVTPFYLSCWYFIIVAEITLGHLSPTFCALSSEFQLSMLDISLLFPRIFLTVGVNLLTHWHCIFAAFYCGFCKELLVLLSQSSPSGDMPWDRFEQMLIQRTWAINTIEYFKIKGKDLFFVFYKQWFMWPSVWVGTMLAFFS